VQCASTIYAAYIGAGRVVEGQEKQWMDRPIREANYLADTTDTAVQSDSEMAAPNHPSRI
jgi:hypothetical protein